MMAGGRDRGRRQAALPQQGGQHLGHPQHARGILKDHPDLVRRVLAVYEEARKYSLANPAE